MTDGERLLRLALEKGALRYGDFTLSSGQRSKYYFDGRLLSLDPEGAYLIGKAIIPILKEAGAQAIGGPTLGADPIVAAVALTSHLNGVPIPAFIVRKDAKSHGTGQLVEGPLVPGSRVAIVDDTCTTGASLFHAIEAAEAAGCTVVKVIAILDRHQGGSEELGRRGFDFTSLLASTPEGEVRVVQFESVDAPSRSSRFWNPPTIEEMALEQGVHPVKDLEQVFGGWPEDADFDSFLEAIHQEEVMSDLNSLNSMAASVANLLKQHQQTVAVAESSCGGLISAALVAVPGASAYYLGGAVIYTGPARQGLLGVPDHAMSDMRASTEPYALMKARTVRKSLGTTWGLSETGASGPTGNRYGDSAGHACIAVAGPVERVITLETGDADREGNMWVFAKAALDMLEQCVREAN